MILNYDKDSQKWASGFTKIGSGIVKGFKKAFTKYSFGDEVLDSLFAGKKLDTKITDILATNDSFIKSDRFKNWGGLEDGEKRAATLGEAFEHAGQGVFSFQNALSSLGSVALNVISTLGTMAIVTAATFVFEKAIEGIYNLIHAQEIAIEKGKEAREKIQGLYDSYDDKKSYVGDNIDTYNQLRQGVQYDTKNGISNLNLSTEDYQQFLSINNELASLFPALVSGYDSQGNAILDLSSNAETATDSLNSFLSKEKEIASYKISEELPTAMKGAFEEIEKYSKELQHYQEEYDKYKAVSDELGEKVDFSDFGIGDNLMSLSDFVAYGDDTAQEIASQILEAYQGAAKDANLLIQGEINQNAFDHGEAGWQYSFNLDPSQMITDDQIQQFEEALRARLDQIQIADNEDVKSEAQVKINEYISEISATWNSVVPSLIDSLSLYDSYQSLGQLDIGEQLQGLISSSISNLDPQSLEDDAKEAFINNPRSFLKHSFLDPLTEAMGYDYQTKEFDKAKVKLVSDLFSLDNNFDGTYAQYYEQAEALVQQLIPDDVEAQQNLLVALKIQYLDDKGNAVFSAGQDLRRLSDITGIDIGSLTSKVNKEEIDFAVDLVAKSNFKFETPDGQDPLVAFREYIQKAMADAQKTIKTEPITFSSLLFDKEDTNGLYTLTVNLQESMEKIQGFQDSMKSGEGADFIGIAKEFGLVAESATELNTSLDQLKVEKLTKFGESYKQMIKDNHLEGDELKAAKDYFQNLVASFDLSNINLSAVREQAMSGVWDNINSKYDYRHATARENVINELLNRENGAEIIARLMVTPEWEGMDPSEMVAAFNDMEIKVKLTAESKEIEDQLAKIETNKGIIEARQSLKQARGEDLSADDYDDLTKIAQQQIEQYQRKIQDYVNQRNWGGLPLEEANKGILEQQANITAAQQQIVENNLAKAQLPLTAIQNRMQLLQQEATEITDEMTSKEQKHLKVTKKDYQNQIRNGEKQIRNLKAQKEEMQKLQRATRLGSSEWYDYQNQIDSVDNSIRQMNQSIDGWNDSINTLALDNITSMSSAVTSALSEIQSETGLTTDTINSLQTAFSDLSGIDMSTLFYRSADGVKVNTDYLERLTTAEYDKQNADLQAQINAARQENDLQRVNALLLEQSQLYAQYAATMEQFNGLSKIEAAEATKNAGANYDTMQGKMETAKSLYEKGLYGTDDFKAYSKYFSATGDTDANVWAENFKRAERYITEDATGVINFLNDLEAKGYAAYQTLDDGSESWVLNLADMNQAALDMGMSYDWFVDELNKTKDYNLPTNFVTSLQDGDQQLNALRHDLAQAQSELAQMEINGVDETTIQNQKNRIADLQNDILMVSEAQGNWVINSKKSYAKALANADDYIAKMKKNWQEAKDDQEKAEILQATNENLSKIGMSVDENFNYDTGAYQARVAQLPQEVVKSWSDLKTAAEKSQDPIKQALSAAHDADPSGIEEITSALQNYTAEQLKSIDLADKKYDPDMKDAEIALDSLLETLGLSTDQAELLIDALTTAGQTKVEPDWSGWEEFEEKEQEVTATIQEMQDNGEISLSFKLDGDIDKLSNGELQRRIDELKEAKIHLSVDSDEYQALDQLQHDYEVQLNINTAFQGGTTIEDLNGLDDETFMATIGCNADEVEYYRGVLEQMNSEEINVPLTVKLDEEQFGALVAPEKNVNITAEVHGTEDVDALSTAIDKVDDKTVEVKEEGASDSRNRVNSLSAAIMRLKGKTLEVIANVTGLSALQSLRNTLLTLQSKTITVTTINQQINKGVTASGTVQVAKATGTAYNVVNYKKAFASGTDVALDQDQDALTNEVGTESIVFLCDFVW